MKPYIAINATALCKQRKTGVEWYTWQLLKYLAREWKESDLPVVLFVPRDLARPRVEMGLKPISTEMQNKNWRIKVLPGKILWTQYHLLKFLKRYPPTLLFSPAYVPPRFFPADIPTVTVVHGLEGEYYPEFKTVKQIIAEHLWVIPATKKSTRIIAVSEHTKKDLNYFYNIPLEKIKTVLSGPGTLNDEYLSVETGHAPSLQKGKVNFLFLGGSERKNPVLATKIFLEIKSCVETGLKPVSTQMYVTGNTDKNKRLSSEHIISFGYVNENEKGRLLKSAHFLLYPSFYEGFGFPVLEAQACGAVPIILKNSGLKETGGAGVIEYDPNSEKKSLSEIVKLIKDPKKYSQMQKKGLKNIQRFSWQTCAREVRKILLEHRFKFIYKK